MCQIAQILYRAPNAKHFLKVAFKNKSSIHRNDCWFSSDNKPAILKILSLNLKALEEDILMIICHFPVYTDLFCYRVSEFRVC